MKRHAQDTHNNDDSAVDTARGRPEPARDAAAATPRYRSIYQALLDQIRRGAFPVGSLLPPEVVLGRQYGASRHTVREAIRILCEDGIVSRRAGVGTRVEATRSNTRFTQQISRLSDLFEYISHATLHVRTARMMRASASTAERLSCAPGSAWLRIIAVKTLQQESTPVAHSEVYVHPDYSAVRSDVGKVKLPLSLLIERKFSQRILEVRQEFSATAVKAETARDLKVRTGSPGFVITRKYYGAHEALMLVTITTFPYRKMKYSMSLQFA
ncbi:MAG: GntR family transcriptional regulator [Burkholderiaceae bacterium]|mgnify:CR=1 FL=1|nr:GntR family transcriptional regulator [Burkholderiaceae bacterium]